MQGLPILMAASPLFFGNETEILPHRGQAAFEATEVDGLQVEFQRSVDEDLLSRQEDGIEPQKPFSGKLNARLGPELHQSAARSAAESGLSLNSWICQTLEKSVA